MANGSALKEKEYVFDLSDYQGCTFCSIHNRQIPCHQFVRYGSCACAILGVIENSSEFCPICIGESKPSQ